VRFRKVLEAAQGTFLYSAHLRAARLDQPNHLKDLTDIRSALGRLGIVGLEQVRVRPRKSKGSPVVLASTLADGFSPDLYWNSTGCVVLEDKSTAKRGARALFIRVGFDEGLLAAIERDGLWQRHGIPMFEHLVGMDGALLAWECEAHCGLHIVEDNAVFESVQDELLLTSLTDLTQPTIQLRTGWTAQIEPNPCDCGRPGSRLIGLREVVALARRSPRPDGMAIAAHI
jgi:hypothetical protein